jgi:hypothetical protein
VAQLARLIQIPYQTLWRYFHGNAVLEERDLNRLRMSIKTFGQISDTIDKNKD